jgi:hypothetical protein
LEELLSCLFGLAVLNVSKNEGKDNCNNIKPLDQEQQGQQLREQDDPLDDNEKQVIISTISSKRLFSIIKI